jgi:signal transduction histidine kinase
MSAAEPAVRSTHPRIHRVVGALAAALIVVGATVLAGWALGSEALRAFGSDINVKANTAGGLLLSGISLALVRPGRRAAHAAGVAAAMVVLAVGAGTLSQHLFGWDLRIDQLLFSEPPGRAATTSPGRMGPPASTCFALAGVALVLLHVRRSIRLAQVLSTVVVMWALLAILGYAYGAQELYGVARYTGIALVTALALLALGLGLLAARADEGPVAVISSDLASGASAREMLLAALLLPALLGWIRILGQRLGYYDTGFGAAIFALALMVFFSAVVWRNAARIADSERRLLAAETETARLYREAQEAVRVRDTFLSVAGHELRTPLNALKLQLYNARRRALAADSTESDKSLSRLQAQIERLIALTNDLLDVSRIQSGRLVLDLADIDLTAVAREVVSRLAEGAERAGSRLILNADAPVRGRWDGFRLDQVLTNLIANALKFGKGGPVEVAVVRRNGAAILSVRDEGIGIAPKDQARIFERFERAVEDRSFGGMGLGLWICKQIVEAHGGTLSVESAPGSGSRFDAALPIEPVHEHISER